MNGPVLLDGHLDPVAPVQMWCDARCADQCAEIESRIPADELLARTGHTAVTGYTAPKLMWFAEHEPDILSQCAQFIFPKDYLVFLLTGKVGTDFSDASNSLLLDVRTGEWDDHIVSALGLGDVPLPPLAHATDVVGSVSRERATWSGLPEGLPVAGGAGDSIAAALGAGLKNTSAIQVVVGSAGNVNCVLNQPQVDSKGRVHTGFFVDREHWICSGVLQAAGSSIQWWADILNMGVEEMVNEMGPGGPSGVLFGPYLAGERTPHLDARVRAGFVSLDGATCRAEMTRAVLEGVAFAFRDAADVFRALDVHPKHMSITGGAARNDTFCRIMADVLNTPLKRIDADVTAMGAAILAACAAGRFANWQDSIEEWPVPGEIFEPAENGKYEEAYKRFRKLYPRLAKWEE
jgi:xylulokinase